ncbi:MAG: hypothetical protein IJR91_00265 [Ruminococcus sp.]|nr:hypothetical protein [Ruminococcus sp.]
MDIIAEILETDRLAEEKLAEAERKRAAMLENVRSEQERFENIAREDSASYAAALEAENNSRLDRELEELDARKQKEFSELEAVFEKNSGRWADEIFSRITAL